VRNITSYLETGPESTPATCLAAIQLARQELDRRAYLDTLSPAERTATDTLLTTVRAIGARCHAAFTAQSVAARDLESYLALALQLGDSSEAAAAAARWAAAPPQQPVDRTESSIVVQCKRIMAAIDMYLVDYQRRTPPRVVQTTLPFTTVLASVQPLVRQLDALGPPARQSALEARAQILLAQLHHVTQQGQWQPEHMVQAILGFLPQIDAAAPADRPSVLTLLELSRTLIRARGFLDPQGVQAFYDSLRTASPTMTYFDTCSSGFWGKAFRARDLSPYGTAGTTVSTLHGAYWFHAPGIRMSDNVWPQPGRVSLLFTFPRELDLADAAMIRRLAAQYGPKGLTITVVTKTQGYWLKDGPNTGPVPPAEEAAHDSAYYLGYLHLPVTLVVDSTTFTRDAEHRLRQSAPVQFEVAYGNEVDELPSGLRAVLVDRTGHCIISSPMLALDEVQLSAYLARAVGQ
jgi:hypothetical protein